MLDKGYVWNDLETEMTICKSTNCEKEIIYITHSFHLGSDTVIDSKNYNVHIDTVFDPNAYGPEYGDTIGFLRETMDSKKIYFLDRYAMEEILLYDFSLSLNDEFSYSDMWDTHVLKVISIDSVDYFGIKRLTFTLLNEDLETINWIEGVGSTKGLLYDKYYFGLLLCLNDNQELIYKNTLGYDCFKSGFDAIQETEVKDALVIYPNPASDYISIDNNELIKSIEIFDLYGNKIYYSNPNINTTKISLLGFNKGLYLMKINSQNVKLIIQ